MTQYYPLIFSCIFLFLCFMFAYIKIRYPFWNLQPVFHVYDIWRRFRSVPYIIHPYRPVKTKFYDPHHIQTFPYLEITEEQQSQFADLLQCHYISSDRLQVTSSAETLKHYFTGNTYTPYISFYYEKEYIPDESNGLILVTNYPVGCITSRHADFYYLDSSSYQKQSVYYLDHICVHREFREKKISRNLIQTHEFYQYTHEPEIHASIFKKEVQLCDGVVPLVKYKTSTFFIRNLKLHPLPDHFILTRVYKENLDLLTNVFQELLTNDPKFFDILAFPSIPSILSLIQSNQYYVYVIKRKSVVYSMYMLKDAKINYDDLVGGDTLELVASVRNTTDPALFYDGFLFSLSAVMKLKPSYKMIVMNDIGHSRILVDEWKKKQDALFENDAAFYLYNMIYPRSPVSTDRCFFCL